MIRTARALHHLFGGGRRRRWAALAALVAITTVLEAVATGLVFLLVTLLSTSAVAVPLAGTVTIGDGTALWFAVTVAGVFAVRGLLVLAQDALLHRTSYGAGAALEEELLLAHIRDAGGHLPSRSRSEVVRTVHDTVISVVEGVLVPLVVGAGLVLRAAGILTVMIVAAPVPTGLAVAAFGPALWLAARGVRGPLRRLGADVEETLSDSLRLAGESLALAPELRLSGQSEPFAERFGRVRRRLARAAALEETVASLPRLIGETLLVLFVVAYLAVAVALGQAAQVLPALALFAYSALRLLPSVTALVGVAHSLSSSDAALREVTADVEAARSVPPPTRAARSVRSIGLRGVVATHPGAEAPALAGIDADFSTGEVVALLGHNGAGKSTLLHVLAGIVPLAEGAVLVDGEPLPAGAGVPASLVAQSVHLLDADVRTNVALRERLTDVEAERFAHAVAAAGLDEVLRRLPLGAATRLGEDGARLSGGERQRVALARAAFQQAPVVLYDEATSALDAQARQSLARLLVTQREGRVTLIVTHDDEVALRCTRAVALRRGRIVADGPPRDVLAALSVLAA